MTDFMEARTDAEGTARDRMREQDELEILNGFYRYVSAVVPFDGEPEKVEDKKQELAQGLYEMFLQLRDKYPK